jgi:hypothetical protein
VYDSDAVFFSLLSLAVGFVAGYLVRGAKARAEQYLNRRASR